MPYLAYIDLQKGQLKNAKQGQQIPVPLPALLIEFGGAQFSELERCGQMGTLTVSVYQYLEHVTDSFDGAEMENETIELLDKQDDVYNTFQGLSCDMFSKMVRTSESTPEYGTRYICLRTDFTTNIKETSETEPIQVKKPTIKLQLNNG